MSDLLETQDYVPVTQSEDWEQTQARIDQKAFEQRQEQREKWWDTPWVKENQLLQLAEEKREEAQEELHDLATDITEEVERRVSAQLADSKVLAALDDSSLGTEVLREKELDRVLDSEDLTAREEQEVRIKAWWSANQA